METYKLSPSLKFVGAAEEQVPEREGLPLYLASVKAGFPSPADDFIEARLDLHKHLVPHESSTFFLHASGDSMVGVGIHDGDLLVVDRSVEARNGRIVIAALEGELTVKRLVRRPNQVVLQPANPDYPEFDITDSEYVHIWGVVTYVIHKL